MLRSFVFVTAAAAIVVACSSSSSGSGSTDASCASIADALCKKIDSCAHLALQVDYPDLATCTARAKLSCLAGANAPSTGTTPSSLDACSAVIAGADCSAVFDRKIPDACQTRLGNLTDGAACGDDAQCVHGLCRRASGATCGACSTPGKAGDACESSDQCAQTGLVCANKVCVARGDAGATCDKATHPCSSTLVCKDGTCVKPAAGGATCDAAQQNCDLTQGFFCNPTTKVCEAVTVASAGQPCGLTGNGYAVCGAGGFCKGAAGAKPGTCLAAAADGQPCDDTNGPQCTSPARCDNGVCKLTDPASCK